jgi:hypothetical protein
MTGWFERESDPDQERAIAAFMAGLAVTPVPGDPLLPEASVLWWKAQLLRRWDAQRRVQAPLDLVETIEIAAGVLAIAVMLVQTMPSLARLLAMIPV